MTQSEPDINPQLSAFIREYPKGGMSEIVNYLKDFNLALADYFFIFPLLSEKITIKNPSEAISEGFVVEVTGFEL